MSADPYIPDPFDGPVPPHNLDAERAVLGAVLLSNVVLDPLLNEVQLRPAHFYRDRHRTIWARMVAMSDAGENVDVVTLTAALRAAGELVAAGGESAVDDLASAVPNVGAVLDYAQVLVADADFRNSLSAGHELVASSLRRDLDGRARAEAMLAQPITSEALTYDSGQLVGMVERHLDDPDPEVFPTPWKGINDFMAGGLRRGEVMLVGGHTSHGKSVVVDQIGDHCRLKQFKVHVWINEMTPRQRALRTAARAAGIDFGRLQRNRLTGLERGEIKAVLLDMAGGGMAGMTDAAGESAEDIARSIRRIRPDVAIVDILHLIPYDDEKDLRRISQVLNRASKQADCAVIATVHLNDGRRPTGTSAVLPRPGLPDIKGASALRQDADHVLFVFREQDPETAAPLNDASLYLSKCRPGQLGGISARFEGARMRLVQAENRLEAA